MKTSFTAGWTYRAKQNSFLELAGAASEPIPITLPHDALIGTDRTPSGSHANAYFSDGVWAYTKTFDVPAEWRDRRVHVQFEGVYREAMVFVNDDLAGAEPNGYSEFIVDLDPFLRYGAENTIKVECRIGDDARWYSGAGIYRPVHLWVQHPVRLVPDGVWITTPEIDDDGAVVEIAAEVRNDTRQTVTVKLTNEIRDPNGAVVAAGAVPVTLRPNSVVTARHRVFVSDPARWSIDAANLYSCTTTVTSSGATVEELDSDVAVFGIRSLQLDPRHGLRINGETVKLRGACIHHDNGPIGAVTIARAEQRRVEILKAAGFNAIRSAHNPTSRALLEACDRLGVVVMDETWDTWNEPKRDRDQSLRFHERWRLDVEAMVRKDRNHPSVVIYSTGNEIPEVGSPLGAALGREIAEYVRSQDSTRYVTTAVQPFLAIRNLIQTIRDFMTGRGADGPALPVAAGDDAPQGVNSQMTAWVNIKDKLMGSAMVGDMMEEICASLDIAGYNYLDNRYVDDAGLYPNRVIVGSETYASAIAQAWPLIVEHPHLIGDFTWTGWDYLGEVGIGRIEHGGDDATPNFMAEFPWVLAHSGDIDITGVRRSQSYFREIVFGLRVEPYIAVQRPENHGKSVTYSSPWSWSDTLGSWTWDGFDGKPVVVEVYSDADEVELVLDGVSVGRQPAGREAGFLATFETTFEPGELVAIALVGGIETGRSKLRSASGQLRVVSLPERSTIVADDTDLAYIAVTVADEDLVVNPGANRTLTATISGPGVLLGFASADPRSTEPYPSPVCTTYDGRALAVIRPTGAGEITIDISEDGIWMAGTRVTATEA